METKEPISERAKTYVYRTAAIIALLLAFPATPALWAAETANGKAVAAGDAVLSEHSASIKPLPFKVPAALPDVAEVRALPQHRAARRGL